MKHSPPVTPEQALHHLSNQSIANTEMGFRAALLTRTKRGSLGSSAACHLAKRLPVPCLQPRQPKEFPSFSARPVLALNRLRQEDRTENASACQRSFPPQHPSARVFGTRAPTHFPPPAQQQNHSRGKKLKIPP